MEGLLIILIYLLLAFLAIVGFITLSGIILVIMDGLRTIKEGLKEYFSKG